MLHLETVESETFSLLEELLSLPALQDYALVGGTALSLLYGHRLSVDLDLFSFNKQNNDDITRALIESFGDKFENRNTNPRFGVFCYINDIKVDIVHSPFNYIKPFINPQNIRMFSTEDIIAMKVQAILGRGKKKDFWDIAELLNHYTVSDFVTFHAQKYEQQNLLISVPQALTYFADAEESEDPISLKNQSWTSIQTDLQEKVKDYLRE